MKALDEPVGPWAAAPGTAGHGPPPTFRETVAEDLRVNAGRPGLRGVLASLAFHPGFAAIFYHRVACTLQARGWQRLSKLVWRRNVKTSSCHLHLDSIIGPGLALPHPTGIVVGSGVQVCRNVTLYQNVTLGRGHRADAYPIIGEGTIVFPNAIIIGPIRVGRNAVIGAGSIVIADVPDHAVVTGNPAKILRIAPPSPAA